MNLPRTLSAALLASLVAAAGRADPVPEAAPPPPASPKLPVVTMRTGDHGNFGRVVFDLPPGINAETSNSGGVVVVHVVGATMAAAGPAPRNVTSIIVAGGEARLSLAPGVTYTAIQLMAHLVIDVFDKPGAAAPAAPAQKGATAESPPVASVAAAPVALARHYFSGPPPRPHPAEAAAAAPPPDIAAGRSEPLRVPLQSLLDGQLPDVLRPHDATPPPAAEAPPPMAAPVTRVDRAVLPEAAASAAPASAKPAAAGPVALVAQPTAGTLTLPFAATTGAAAFRRGGEMVVVFDERRPVDLAALNDDKGVAAAFADARVQLLPDATVLRFALPPGAGLALSRRDDGWVLTRVTPPPALEPIRGDVAGDAMVLAAAAPAAVVSVPDPQTGGALLVGTQMKPGQGVPVARRTPDFTLLETLQGVAVDPASDALTLHVAPAKQPPGFVLAADAGPAEGSGVALDPLGPEAIAALAAAHMTRRWDFPALPTTALLRRLEAATADAAAVAPEGRTARRLQAVQAEIALGMGAEANALATLAVTDDARAADSVDAAGLGAVGALLAGRIGEAGAIADPRLDGTDEVALWRAVQQAMQREGAPEAATTFVATMPLLLAYPAALRDRLLPLAAETMAQGGERAAARRLLDARKDDGALDFARALLAERDGHAAPVLAIYDRLAQSTDRRARARASVRAVELRLHEGALSTAQAADALDRLIYSWRGGKEELALRLRVADLRAQSGNWRGALALLRETGATEVAESWPDQKPMIRARMAEVFAQALASESGAGLAPLELASLIDENPDLLPDGEAGRALAARLADRLVALDLPRRADPVLEKLMNAAPEGAPKAELGARLAAVRLEQADPAGALRALSASTATDLPPALDEARTIAFARATAARGALAPAVAALATLGTAGADEARAALLEQAKDWPGAEQALASYASKTVPTDGALAEEQARLLLRLASAAAQAGDETLLARLRERELSRMPPGKTAELFKLLTEQPVQGVADLPRAAQETALAHNVPAELKSLGASATQP